MSTSITPPMTATVAVILMLAFSAAAQMLADFDRLMIDSALTLVNLKPAELGFDKLWAEDDTFRLAVVEKYLNAPLEFPGYVDQTAAVIDSCAREPFALVEFVAAQLQVDPQPKKFTPPSPLKRQFDAADPFGLWLEALEAAEPLRRKFYADLDSLDLHDLLMEAPVMWNEADDTLKKPLRGAWQREAGLTADTSREVDIDRLLDIVKKFDVASLMRAAMNVLPAAQQTARGAASMNWDETLAAEAVEGVTGIVIEAMDTKWGKFVIGGRGDNIYTGDFAAIIDVGGDDVYRGRVGGAMGGLGNPYSLLIDLGGNDYYDARGMDVAHGAGFLGIGILIDRGGGDVYRSGNYSQGAGFFGVGVLADHGGSDDRRGGYFMQGAGHVGFGYLIDDGGDGDDRYLSTAWAQGFGSTYGYGLLYDSGGDDTYRAGGEFLHQPLLPHDNRSFSGGFGMGWRPRAGGGIGVLYDDGEGNDFYDAEVMAFGSSYWYSIGILIDGGGNDYYSLAHYGLGVGIHLSLGALFDKAGDDQYRSRWGVVGGTPHDLSVGIMVDGSGDDMYIVGDGWGGSLTNSFGLFIDRLGNDTYATRGGGYSFGRARWARGFAGAAIFLDLEGDDVYPAGDAARDSLIWISGGWGIGIDLARDIVTTAREEEIGEVTLTAEDSAKSIEDLFKEASEWEVGSAVKSVKRARKALLERGPEVMRWVVEHKLDTRSALEKRLLDEIAKAFPDSAGPLLTERIHSSKDRYELGNCANMLGTIKWKPAVGALTDLIRAAGAEKVRNAAIAALGDIGDSTAAPAIAQFISDRAERRRITAINALKSLKSTQTIDAIANRLSDDYFTVRSAAAEALAAFGLPATEALMRIIENKDQRYPELGVQILGRIASAVKDSSGVDAARLRYRAAKVFERASNSANDQVRAAGVEALYDLGGDATRGMVDAWMETEFSPVVLAAYRRAKGM